MHPAEAYRYAHARGNTEIHQKISHTCSEGAAQVQLVLEDVALYCGRLRQHQRPLGLLQDTHVASILVP